MNQTMSGNRDPEKLSTDELRRLLVQKQRSAHQDRLNAYRKTGRVIHLERTPEILPLGELRSNPIDEDTIETRNGGASASKPRRVIDKVLMVIELAAVLGLVYVLFSGMNLVRQLNQEVAAVLQQPTLTATPLISAVVLPSGHTPPNSAGGAQPNDNEIPEHLRPLVQSIAAIPIPTQGPEQAVRIQISALKLDAPIVQGDGWEQLKKGVGQHVGSANPGSDGNLVLSAHNDIYGEIFRNLDKLKPGDTIIIYTSQRQISYVVSETKLVSPTQVDIMAQSSSPTLTLISCYPYMVDNQRIVVQASMGK
jgi:sortase A